LTRRLRSELEHIEFRWRPALVVGCVCVTLAISHYHPRGEWFWPLFSSVFPDDVVRWLRFVWLGPDFLLEVFGSLIVIALVLREPLRSYGLGLGDWRFGLKACAVLAILFVPLFVLMCTNAAFRDYYGAVARDITSWRQFLLWKIPAFVFFMVMTELFFRGFLLFGIRKHYGTFAGILASQLAFVAWHFDKPEMEAFGSIVVGLALAYLSVRTRSIWYGVLLHAGFAALFEGVLIATA
jgi:membrane protease YdiL (CAAX protease family)